ncbi:cation transporter [Methylomonas rapida]|uniref:Cation transporter n=1 Tax=Methylomonas rapida TaxID=2963939 RepID=A0ABY7GNA0_9GAMM|nr:cation transporter [Methylomonas rapida]WAR45985.1 cation transporter [Methylomonas rapida]
MLYFDGILIDIPTVKTMASCCDGNCAAEALREKQRGTLIKVLVINALMFVVIVIAAWYGKSTALLSDSLDNLGDAITYGLSLFAVSRSSGTKARVALFKGGLILAASLAVVAQIVHRLMVPVLPSYEIMSIFSMAGLAANGLCLYLLWRHRDEDINMSSVFECSRNDIASNLSVVIAAAGVWLFDNLWPDIIVASLLALLLLISSVRVIRGALIELRQP